MLRITNSAYDIPAAVRTRSIATTIDYDPVAIGGRDYLLPVEASVLLDTGSHHVWNRMQFRDYQKFGADSDDHFRIGAPRAPTPPLFAQILKRWRLRGEFPYSHEF